MYKGYFINLSRSGARQHQMVEQLAFHGVGGRYQRFPAVDGQAVFSSYRTGLTAGELGGWLSHTSLWQGLRGEQMTLHVLEDDTVVAMNCKTLFDSALQHVEEARPDWDILFT